MGCWNCNNTYLEVVKLKKLMKSKRGFIFTAAAFAAIPWILGLTLFGIPVFATWLKIVTTPSSTGFSPVWIIVGGFVVILLLKRR